MEVAEHFIVAAVFSKTESATIFFIAQQMYNTFPAINEKIEKKSKMVPLISKTSHFPIISLAHPTTRYLL